MVIGVKKGADFAGCVKAGVTPGLEEHHVAPTGKKLLFLRAKYPTPRNCDVQHKKLFHGRAYIGISTVALKSKLHQQIPQLKNMLKISTTI